MAVWNKRLQRGTEGRTVLSQKNSSQTCLKVHRAHDWGKSLGWFILYLQNYTCSPAVAPLLKTSLFAGANAFWVARQISPQGLWSNPVNLPTSRATLHRDTLRPLCITNAERSCRVTTWKKFNQWHCTSLYFLNVSLWGLAGLSWRLFQRLSHGVTLRDETHQTDLLKQSPLYRATDSI